jgi:hypothetical protein
LKIIRRYYRMASGRVELVSTGVQDQYITDLPTFTYFHKQYRRHTRFSTDTIMNSFEGEMNFGGTLRCIIPRKGDLIKTIYIKLNLPILSGADTTDSVGYTDSIGHAIIEYADLLIGGQTVERITSETMEIYHEMYTSDSHQESLKYTVGKTGSLTGLGPASGTLVGEYGAYPRQFLVALPFYFFRNPSMAIPLCALDKHEVEVVVKLRELSKVVTAASLTDEQVQALNIGTSSVTDVVPDFAANVVIQSAVLSLQSEGEIAGSENVPPSTLLPEIPLSLAGSSQSEVNVSVHEIPTGISGYGVQTSDVIRTYETTWRSTSGQFPNADGVFGDYPISIMNNGIYDTLTNVSVNATTIHVTPVTDGNGDPYFDIALYNINNVPGESTKTLSKFLTNNVPSYPPAGAMITDASGWYHIILQIDPDNKTLTLYVNGAEVASDVSFVTQSLVEAYHYVIYMADLEYPPSSDPFNYGDNVTRIYPRAQMHSLAVYTSDTTVTECRTQADLDDPSNKLRGSDLHRFNVANTREEYQGQNGGTRPPRWLPSMTDIGTNGSLIGLLNASEIPAKEAAYDVDFMCTHNAIPRLDVGDKFIFLNGTSQRYGGGSSGGNFPGGVGSRDVTFNMGTQFRLHVWEGSTKFPLPSDGSTDCQAFLDNLHAWGTERFVISGLDSNRTFGSTHTLASDNGNGGFLMQGRYTTIPASIPVISTIVIRRPAGTTWTQSLFLRGINITLNDNIMVTQVKDLVVHDTATLHNQNMITWANDVTDGVATYNASTWLLSLVDQRNQTTEPQTGSFSTGIGFNLSQSAPDSDLATIRFYGTPASISLQFADVGFQQESEFVVNGETFSVPDGSGGVISGTGSTVPLSTPNAGQNVVDQPVESDSGSTFISTALSSPAASSAFQYFETRGYYSTLSAAEISTRITAASSASFYSSRIDLGTIVVDPTSTLSADGRFRCELPVEYVYVTQSEIDFFKSRGVDYLITQTQVSTVRVLADQTLVRARLGFTNPCKELWMAVQTNSNVTQKNDLFCYTNHRHLNYPKYQQVVSMNLDFNHETRVSSEVADTNLLRYMQPMRHHTRVPTRDIYCYSFAIDPESDTPSGQVNLSRILNKELTLNLTPMDEARTVKLYARVYNILRIQHGLGGVIFNDVAPN